MISYGISLFLLVFWLPIPPFYSYSILAVTGFLLLFSRISDGGLERKLISSLVVIFAAFSIISIFLSEDIKRSVYTSLHQELGILMFFIIAYGYRRVNDFVLTFLIYSLITFLISTYLLLVATGNLSVYPLQWARMANLPAIAVPNDIAFCCLTAPLFLCVCNYFKNKTLYVGFLIYLILIILTATAYRSAVGLLCILVSLTIYILLTGNKKYLLLLLLIFFISAIVDFSLGTPLSSKFIQTIRSGGWDPRIALWLVALGMFFNDPISGQGPHTFVNYYNSTVIKLDLPPDLTIDTRIVPWAHNLYLEILAERGLFVFITFLAMIFLILFQSLRKMKMFENDVRYLAYGAFSALAGFCVGAFFEFTFLRIWVIIYLFSLIGCIVGLWSFTSATVELEE